MRALAITTTDPLRRVDHRAIIAWERMQREQEGAAASTVHRRLAALSSLFMHLVRHGAANRNPVVDVERPTINRDAGNTAAFSKAQAGRILDAPLFRPPRGNAKPLDAAGRMDPDAIDRLVRKYAAVIGLGRGYSAHSMRATFITTALENGAQLEDVQKAGGIAIHPRRSSTTGAAIIARRPPAFLRLIEETHA
jgi:site-specific recombinase XerD